MKETQKIAILVENKKAFRALKSKLSNCEFFYRRNSGLFKKSCSGIEVVFLETGIGKKNINYCIPKMLKEHRVDFAIFFGFMGALNKNIKVGDIIIPSRFTDISEPGEEYGASQKLLGFCRFLEKDNSIKLHFTDKNITVDRVYLGAEKLSVKKNNPEMSSLDMEAFSIAKIFSKENVPFIIISAVFDEWDFSFHNFNFLVNAEYKTSLLRLLFYCIRHPRETPNLVYLIRNVKKALKNNLSFLESYLNNLIQQLRYN